MPKQALTSERFRIHAECSIEEVGPILAFLTKMGGTQVGYELITDVRSFDKNKTVKHDVKAVPFAQSWIDDHPSFQLNELAAHFKANDRAPTTAYYAVKKLREAGLVKQLGEGTYQAQKLLEGPKKGAAVQPARTAINLTDFVVTFVRRKKSFNTKEIVSQFQAKGLRTKSLYGVVDRLMKSGAISRIGEPGSGQYNVNTAKMLEVAHAS